MGKWFHCRHRQQEASGVPEARLVEYAESVEIRVPRREVWALIKPVENSILLDPDVVKAFNLPGTPTGASETQCFISRRNGKEQINAIEILDEVPEVRAVTRSVGDDDETRHQLLLTDSSGGPVLKTVSESWWTTRKGSTDSRSIRMRAHKQQGPHRPPRPWLRAPARSGTIRSRRRRMAPRAEAGFPELIPKAPSSMSITLIQFGLRSQGPAWGRGQRHVASVCCTLRHAGLPRSQVSTAGARPNWATNRVLYRLSMAISRSYCY